MKKVTRIVLAVTTLTASALAYSGSYFNLGGGYVVPTQNFNTSTTATNSVLYSPTPAGTGVFNAQNFSWNNNLNNGGEVNVALGYAFDNKLRTDFEFMFQSMARNNNGAYDWNQVSNVSGDSFANTLDNPITTTHASFKVYSFLANLYYDFKNKSHWTPSVGVGIGTAHILCGNASTNNTLTMTDSTSGAVTTVPTTVTSSAVSAATFAWQIKMGVAYQFDDNVSISGDYRFFATTNYKIGASEIIVNPATANQATFTAGNQHVNGLRENILELNLRYNL